MSSRKLGAPAGDSLKKFKEGAVRLVLDEGKTVGAVARELDLTGSSLATWVKHARNPLLNRVLCISGPGFFVERHSLFWPVDFQRRHVQSETLVVNAFEKIFCSDA